MLETIQKGFSSAKNILRGQTQLTESNIEEALREVRFSLLEADVEYSVAKNFLQRVRDNSLGKTVQTSATNEGIKKKLSPYEHFIGSCYQELLNLMGPVDTTVNLSKPVGTIMMVGLQGAGKTTTTAKLAAYLQKKQLKPLLVAADLQRPAAIEQLKVLGTKLNVPVYHEPGLTAPQLCKNAIQKAKEHQCNTVIFDTAGRLAVNEELMQELEDIKQLTNPDNIFLVIDSMIGQDSVKTAAEFHRRLDIDGFILTKLDGDARGGAALSIKEITGKPIKFLGMGEHINNFEEFRPEGLASRILGMGDIVSLVKDFEEHVDEAKAEKDAMRMLQGRFTLSDFLEQLKLIKKMGPIKDIMAKIPGMGEMLKGQTVDDKEFVKLESIMLSMTPLERENPMLVQKQARRKQRIANGSGKKVKDVDELLQRFFMMQKMMQMLGSKPSLFGNMPIFREMGQMSKLTQAFGGNGRNELTEMFNGFGIPGGGMGGFPTSFGPKTSFAKPSAASKAKRKAQKQARKKNKKK